MTVTTSGWGGFGRSFPAVALRYPAATSSGPREGQAWALAFDERSENPYPSLCGLALGNLISLVDGGSCLQACHISEELIILNLEFHQPLIISRRNHRRTLANSIHPQFQDRSQFLHISDQPRLQDLGSVGRSIL